MHNIYNSLESNTSTVSAFVQLNSHLSSTHVHSPSSEALQAGSDRVAFDALNTNLHGWNEPPMLSSLQQTPNRSVSAPVRPNASPGEVTLTYPSIAWLRYISRPAWLYHHVQYHNTHMGMTTDLSIM